MPDNLDEPSHRLMREIAEAAPWAAKLRTPPKPSAPSVTAPNGISAWLRAHAPHVDVWRTTYFHPLAEGAHAIVEWVKGTGLRPFLDPLDEERSRRAFLARYEAAIAKAYPAEAGRDRSPAVSQALLRRRALNREFARSPFGG